MKPLSKRAVRETIAEATKKHKCVWVSREKVERREAEGLVHFTPPILEGDAELMYTPAPKAKKAKPVLES